MVEKQIYGGRPGVLQVLDIDAMRAEVHGLLDTVWCLGCHTTDGRERLHSPMLVVPKSGKAAVASAAGVLRLWDAVLSATA